MEGWAGGATERRTCCSAACPELNPELNVGSLSDRGSGSTRRKSRHVEDSLLIRGGSDGRACRRGLDALLEGTDRRGAADGMAGDLHDRSRGTRACGSVGRKHLCFPLTVTVSQDCISTMTKRMCERKKKKCTSVYKDETFPRGKVVG